MYICTYLLHWRGHRGQDSHGLGWPLLCLLVMLLRGHLLIAEHRGGHGWLWGILGSRGVRIETGVNRQTGHLLMLQGMNWHHLIRKKRQKKLFSRKKNLSLSFFYYFTKKGLGYDETSARITTYVVGVNHHGGGGRHVLQVRVGEWAVGGRM